jgi:hypothetical protein
VVEVIHAELPRRRVGELVEGACSTLESIERPFQIGCFCLNWSDEGLGLPDASAGVIRPALRSAPVAELGAPRVVVGLPHRWPQPAPQLVVDGSDAVGVRLPGWLGPT